MYISRFLGYDILYPGNIILLSEKYLSQEVASNKLEKGPLRDYKTVFCSPVGSGEEDF
jgi:hypothetical protein